MVLGESFSIGESIVHRIDPRYKMAAATILSSVIAVSSDFFTLVLSIFSGLVLAGLARLAIWILIKRVLIVWGFVLLMWLVLPFTFEGEILFHIGSLAVMRPGVVLAGQITLKSIAILLVFISLVATIPIATVGYSLSCFHIPDKIVFLFLMTYRYFFVLNQEYDRLVRAAKMRGFQPRTNIHTYKTYAYLVGMLFVRASARADRVHQAMNCRGFHGTLYTLHEFPSHPRNMIFSVWIGFVILILVYLEWNGL